MRRAELSVGHAGALPAQHDVDVAVGRVGLDLLERAAGQERRGGRDEGQQAAVGQAGADADEVLLGDADVDQPLGELLAEADEVARADGVVADGDDALVLARQRDQLLRERLAAVVRLGVLRNEGHRESSWIAASTCWASGTLWCHSTRSSMKDTPLPLIVWAITATGLPVLDGARASSRAL